MYVQLHDTLLDHHKLIDLAALVKMPKVRALGHMATLWLNAGRHRPDGKVSEWSDKVFALYSDWRGDPQSWRTAVKEAGFLDANGDLNDWGDYFSEKIIAARRRKDREKKRRQRARKRK